MDKSIKNKSIPKYTNCVEAFVETNLVLEKIDENTTGYYYIISADISGWLPTNYFVNMTKSCGDKHKLMENEIKSVLKKYGKTEPHWSISEMLKLKNDKIKLK